MQNREYPSLTHTYNFDDLLPDTGTVSTRITRGQKSAILYMYMYLTSSVSVSTGTYWTL